MIHEIDLLAYDMEADRYWLDRPKPSKDERRRQLREAWLDKRRVERARSLAGRVKGLKAQIVR